MKRNVFGLVVTWLAMVVAMLAIFGFNYNSVITGYAVGWLFAAANKREVEKYTDGLPFFEWCASDTHPHLHVGGFPNWFCTQFQTTWPFIRFSRRDNR